MMQTLQFQTNCAIEGTCTEAEHTLQHTLRDAGTAASATAGLRSTIWTQPVVKGTSLRDAYYARWGPGRDTRWHISRHHRENIGVRSCGSLQDRCHMQLGLQWRRIPRCSHSTT
ncbi:unnamed protein product [Durusdinium trenchii]|uniref:Uncharacterized protein n=2 Tax=Durusdinium trenchii TaxID=1381693 RepID=A0ABP0HUK6_9DINO